MKFLCEAVPACPGQFKSQREDFRVEELPLYPFSGQGDHTLVLIEKEGLSTFEAVRRLSRALDFNDRDVGVAGLKDAHGITRQWLSFEHMPPARFEGLDVAKVRVIQTTRHNNKLKRGHLAGNRFEVVLRDVAEADVPHAKASLALLQQRGVPNWYDTQRFGRGGNNAALGLAILRGDYEAYFRAMLGNAAAETHGPLKEARKAYDDGNLDQALALWPRHDNVERGALKAVKDFGPTDKALRRVPQKIKLLQVSSVQSLLFNRVLERRFGDLDKVWDGDICEKENGACFLVADPAVEQPRVETFEISPTGPIFGFKMMQPSGRTAELEREVLHAEGLTETSFEVGKGLSQKGDRRALRFRIRDAALSYAADERALTLRFDLPKGCYATIVLREITRQGESLTLPAHGAAE